MKNEYEIEVKWYLALCYIQTNQIDESLILLKELTEYEGKYQEDANELLKKL